MRKHRHNSIRSALRTVVGTSTAAALVAAVATVPFTFTARPAAASAAEADLNTTPIFKPFVMVRIPLPTGYISGRVTAVNNDGVAVGWMLHDTLGEQPFVFDRGVFEFLTIPGDVDRGEALGINDDEDPLIVGYLNYTAAPAGERAAVWKWDSENQTSSFEQFLFAAGVESVAYSVGEDLVVGVTSPSSGPRAFVFDLDGQTSTNPVGNVDSEATHVNANGGGVGWRLVSGDVHAWMWSSGGGVVDLHPGSPYDHSVPEGVTDSGHAVGWVEEFTDVHIPAWWEVVAEPPHLLSVFPAAASATARAMNDEGEILIVRDDGFSGVALLTRVGQTNYAHDLTDLVLTRNPDDVFHDAWALNDELWIGGSYLEGGTGNPKPCLVIPYDVDNNGIPDYREIVQSEWELDDNGNWLIDWGEDLRIGLHTPSKAQDPEGGIDPVQIVRLGANVGPHGVQRGDFSDEDWLEDIVGPEFDCGDCTAYFNAVTRWGTGEGRYNEDLTSEILVRVHSMMGLPDLDENEALPDPNEPGERLVALNDLFTFGYRFARCIDWLQWGNESFGGARGYIFRDDDLCNTDCRWTGDPIEFGDLKNLPGGHDCTAEAVELILEWQKEMMWAALEGSALAGRPLRMVSTGLGYQAPLTGYHYPGNADALAAWYITSRLSDWCNENQVYYSMHVHYTEVQPAVDGLEKLTGTGNWTSPPWTPPNWRISTEAGARADFTHGWWSRHDFEVPPINNKRYFSTYFFDTYGDPKQGDTYELFVSTWMNDPESQWDGDGPQLDVIFAAFKDAGFTGLCWSAMQWNKGPDADNLSVYLIEALRANQVRNDLQNAFEQGNEEKRYTPLKDDFEEHGAQHKIDPFTPHEVGCEECEVCPTCCQ